MTKLELTPGAPVYCKDGKCGALTQVLLDPSQASITHIVIENGFLHRRTRVIPIAVVIQATTGDIYLTLSDDQVNQCPTSIDDVGGMPLFPLESGAAPLDRDAENRF